MATDIATGKPCLGNITGGLSGPAIKPIALYMVYEVAKVAHISLIGCGGIACAADALEFIMAGASAIQVGTANLTNPYSSLAILEEIGNFMKDKGIKDLTELIGVAQNNF
jgi:dihydroorotate dehydrogenase (NAD+) catalytic subunit